MKNVSFLIKPASSLCNMRCRYCFYEDEAQSRQTASMGVMSRDTAALLIRRALEGADRGGQISFAFQGGEPTVAGLDFFRDFVAMVQAQNTGHIPVSWSIQTNGLSVDRAWADFFRDNRFLVGVSLDGDKALHDEFRLDAGGKGTWTRVSRGLELLQKAGVEVNLLCVVTKRCAKNPVRIYNALKKTGVGFLQFIPCLDPLERERGTMDWSLTPEDYGTFLCKLFDVWYGDWEQGRYTSVRLFDDYVHLAMGLPSGTCATSGSCGAYFVVEADGGVYPCDFYVLDQWKLGDLAQASLTQLAQSPKAAEFLAQGDRHPAKCASCPWQRLCFGGCKRDWVTDPATGESQNYYCEAFQRFFAYAGDRLGRMAQAERMARRGS